MPRKNPWIAAILNFLWYGFGYVYNGKRVAFGAGLIILELIEYFAFFTIYSSNVGLILSLLFGLLFAYDGYNEALEINKGAKRKR